MPLAIWALVLPFADFGFVDHFWAALINPFSLCGLNAGKLPLLYKCQFHSRAHALSAATKPMLKATNMK
jgi:hypothetical protein